MNLSSEIAETVFALIPGLCAIVIAVRTPKKVYGWAFWVLGSSVLGVIALGLLLKRLTAGCPMRVPQCQTPQVVVKRIPGILSDCYQCANDSLSELPQKLNELALPIQGISAALCVLLSFYTVIRFVFWARRVFKQEA
jgi:hypothetical protein